LESALRGVIAAKGLDRFLFVIPDILNNDSVAVALGPRASVVETAYGVTLESNRALLAGVVSRKLQIVPVLTETFSKG
jgi:manganese-dependent inorganic pyrophosphatase